MATVEKNFPEWLENELRNKDWNPAKLAKKSGVGAGVLSRILNRERQPSIDTLKSIGEALGYPPSFMMRMAGIIESIDEDPTDEELLFLYDQLSEKEQEEIREWIRFKVEQNKKKG